MQRSGRVQWVLTIMREATLSRKCHQFDLSYRQNGARAVAHVYVDLADNEGTGYYYRMARNRANNVILLPVANMGATCPAQVVITLKARLDTAVENNVAARAALVGAEANNTASSYPS